MGATLLVFSIAHGTGAWTPARLLLTGVVLAAGFSAATTLLLALSPDQHLRGMLFWLMGGLEGRTWQHAAITATGFVLFALLIAPRARQLDLLTLQEETGITKVVDPLAGSLGNDALPISSPR